MRKKIEYVLEYREEGEQKETTINIDFVSNRVLRDFSNLLVLSEKAQSAYDRISDINTIIAGEEITEDEIKKYREESENCLKQIMEFNENGYFEKRSEILSRLLVDNGYKNDRMLMNNDFWEECVEPSDLMGFMTKAVYKDTDQKKKRQ